MTGKVEVQLAAPDLGPVGVGHREGRVLADLSLEGQNHLGRGFVELRPVGRRGFGQLGMGERAHGQADGEAERRSSAQHESKSHSDSPARDTRPRRSG